jgi:5-methylcytosine-specific restriction enzyme A
VAHCLRWPAPAGRQRAPAQRGNHGPYVIAAKLIVKGNSINPDGYHYGKYRVWGDLGLSRYYDIQQFKDNPGSEGVFEGLVRQLTNTEAEHLGTAFNGANAVKEISNDGLLERYAEHLKLEPRAALVPEDRLEALMSHDDDEAVDALIREHSTPELAEERRLYLWSLRQTRRADLVRDLRKIYGGRCQLCAWDSIAEYGIDLCEAHHVRWLGRGGKDVKTNIIMVPDYAPYSAILSHQ